MANKKTCNAWGDLNNWDEVTGTVNKDYDKMQVSTNKETKERGKITWLTIQKQLIDRLAPIKESVR